MSDPTSLYRHIPDAFSRRDDSDIYRHLAALATGTEAARLDVVDFREDLTIDTADGDGLNRLGENYDCPRSPGMTDTRYRALLKAFVGAKRGTIPAIQAVYEAATGISVTVEDTQLNASVPIFEVWITPVAGFSESYGLGMFPGLAASNYDGWPVESSIVGEMLPVGDESGTYNDHVWAPVDIWTDRIMEKVKLAGTKLVYK